jgi:hypothetical protein
MYWINRHPYERYDLTSQYYIALIVDNLRLIAKLITKNSHSTKVIFTKDNESWNEVKIGRQMLGEWCHVVMETTWWRLVSFLCNLLKIVVCPFVLFRSPCQRQCELLPSLAVRLATWYSSLITCVSIEKPLFKIVLK